MDTSLRTSTSTVSRREPGESQGPANERGVEQHGGTSSKLASLKTALAGQPGIHQGAQSLTDTMTSLREDVGSHKTLDLYDGTKHVFDREAKNAGNAGTALLKLTGDPTTATALSHYLGQHMMASLEAGKLDLLKGPNDRLNFMLDGEQTFSDQVRRNPPDKEGGEVTYTIDYTITNPVGHLGNGPDDHLKFKPGSEMQLAMQVTVKESDLRAGNGAFTVTGQPSYQLHLEPDIAGIVHPKSL